MLQRIRPLILLIAVALMGAGTTRAVTIGVGSDTVDGYTLDYYIDTQAKATALAATSGPGAMAFFNDGVDGFSNNPNPEPSPSVNGILHPETADGIARTIIFHFQPDPGFQITGAMVNSAVYVFDTSGDPDDDASFVKGYWSTDNLSYNPFLDVVGDVPSDTQNRDVSTIDLADHGFTEGQDLYLKYDLMRLAGSDPTLTQLFRSRQADENTSGDGFIVNLTLAPLVAEVPEPSTLVLLALGAMIVLRWAPRRRAV